MLRALHSMQGMHPVFELRRKPHRESLRQVDQLAGGDGDRWDASRWPSLQMRLPAVK